MRKKSSKAGNKMFKIWITLILITGTVSGTALGDSTAADDMTIVNAWAREVVVPGMNGGAYFTIRNNDTTPDRLVSVKTDVADATELHQSIVKDGMMHMQLLADGIDIPGNSTVELKPGGLHLMLLKVKRKIAPGEKIPATFTFETAGDIEMAFAVQPLGGQGMTPQ
jgi:copper(I)-binding protein